MNPSFVRRSLAKLGAPVATLALVAAPLAAQRAPIHAAAEKATVFDVTPYAGFVHFGHYLDGPLGTSLKAANAPVVGAQVGLALGPNLGVVGNVAYGSADLQVGVPILGGLNVGKSTHLLYDADLELRVPMQSQAASTMAVTPFIQAGAGAITTHLQQSIINTSSTNAAFNAGAGLDLSLGRGFGARAMVKDYIGRFDMTDDTGLPLKGDVTHSIACSVGLRLSF